MSEKYRPRECLICGKLYTPKRVTQVTCLAPECKQAWKTKSIERYHLDYVRPREVREPKPDTIVAIGYAERQIAESLKLAGPVKKEL